jgi:hypothetical protein
MMHWSNRCLEALGLLVCCLLAAAGVSLCPHDAMCSTWAPAAQVNMDDDRDDWGPAIDVDNDGVVWAVWGGRDPAHGDLDIYFARNIGGVWEEPRRLHADNQVDDPIPMLSIGRDGVPWVAWKSGYDFRNWDLVVSRWSGGWWSEPDTLAGGLYVTAAQGISALDSTDVWVVWDSIKEESPYDWDVKVRGYSEGSWGETFQFGVKEDDDHRPSVTVDSVGMPWVSWGRYSNTGGWGNIKFTRRESDGWSSPSDLNDPGTGGFYSDLATARDGQIWAVWGGAYLTSHADEEIMCARWSGGGWDTVRTVNEPDWGGEENDQGQAIYAGERSWPAVVWNAVLGPQGPPYVDVRYAAWDGQRWTEEEVVSVYQYPEHGEDIHPDVAVGPDGRVWVAWLKSDGPPGYDQDVYVTYSDDALPIVVHDWSVEASEVGVELNWSAFGYRDLGSFDVYRLEVSGEDTCEGREIPERAVKINEGPLVGAERMTYVDGDVKDEGEYCYWLDHTEGDGTRRSYIVGSAVVPVRSLGDEIRMVYPNPSGGGVSVAFEMREEGEVEFEVYDVAGRKVRAVALGRKSRGVYEGERAFDWNARNGDGERVPAGVYMMRMVVGGEPVDSAKAVLLP